MHLKKLLKIFYAVSITALLYGSVTIIGYTDDGKSIVETIMESLGIDAMQEKATPSDAGKIISNPATPSDATKTSAVYAPSGFITLPQPTRKGYTFIEWNTSKDGSGDAYEAGDEIEITDMALYAIWEKNDATPSEAVRIATISNAKRATASDAEYDDTDDYVIPDIEIY